MVVANESRLAQMNRGTLPYCVLALLIDEEHYGFELVRRLSEIEGMVTSEGTIYPLLSRLRKEGLLASEWRESASGPPRRYYRLTKAGHAALRRFVGEWRSFRDAIDSLLVGPQRQLEQQGEGRDEDGSEATG